MNATINPLQQKYHSFDDWMNMSTTQKGQWYSNQVSRQKKGFTRKPENETAFIESVERSVTMAADQSMRLSEINY